MKTPLRGGGPKSICPSEEGAIQSKFSRNVSFPCSGRLQGVHFLMVWRCSGSRFKGCIWRLEKNEQQTLYYITASRVRIMFHLLSLCVFGLILTQQQVSLNVMSLSHPKRLCAGRGAEHLLSLGLVPSFSFNASVSVRAVSLRMALFTLKSARVCHAQSASQA